MSTKPDAIIVEQEGTGGTTVKVHKAYPGKVEAIKKDLHKYHSDNGKPLHTSEHGDYVHIHLPKKEHNNHEAVKRTLKDHEDHPAYSPNNVNESKSIVEAILSKDETRINEAKTSIKNILNAKSAKFVEDSSKFIAKSLFSKD